MKLETLKSRIDRIAARRMIRDSAAHFNQRDADAKWFWRFCKFCGDFYNFKLKPWTDQGATKNYCGGQCAKTAHEIATAAKIRQNTLTVKRQKHYLKPKTRDAARFDVLSKAFGKTPFTYAQAARALKIVVESAMEHVLKLESMGLLRRISGEKTGTKTARFVAIEEVEK